MTPRVVDRTGLVARLVGAFWVLLLVAPFYQSAYGAAFGMRLQSGPYLLFTFLAVQLLQVAEVGLLSTLVLAATRTRGRRLVRVSSIVASLVATLVYHGLVYASWAYRDATGEFLPRRVLDLTPFVTASPTSFWGFLSSEDRARLVTALVATVLASTVAAVACSTSPATWTVRSRLRRVGAAFAAALVVGTGSLVLLPSLGRTMALQLFRYGASPSVTLLWAPLFAPLPEVELPHSSAERFVPRAELPDGKHGPDAPDLYVFIVEALRSDVATAPEHAEVTPYLHHLATRPLSRARCIAQATESSESLAVMLSGSYALRSEGRDLRVSPAGRQSVFERVRLGGYRTAFLGEMWRIDRAMTSRGVDHRVDPQEQRGAFADDPNDPWKTAVYANVEADRLKLRRLIEWSKSQSAPVAAITYLRASHYPYQDGAGVPTRYLPIALHGDPSFLGYDEALYGVMWNRYRNTLVEIDALLARFVERIEAARPGRPRVVIVTGDHGDAFGEHGAVTHGRSIYPEILLVPCLIDAPAGWLPAGPTLPAHVDLFATMLTFAGLPVPPNQGTSLVGRDASLGGERPVFATSQLYVSEDAVVSEGALFTLSYDTLETRLFDLQSRERRDDRARALRLCACLLQHRADQFHYHRGLQPLALTHAPPRWDACEAPPDALRECDRLLRRPRALRGTGTR